MDEAQTVRPAVDSDAEAVAGVANAVSEQLYGETAVSAEEIRRWSGTRESRPASSR